MHHHAYSPRAGEGHGGGVNRSVRSSVGTVEGIYPLLPEEAPWTVRRTPLGWEAFTITEAVAALRFR